MRRSYRVFGRVGKVFRASVEERAYRRRWVRQDDREIETDQGGFSHGSYSTLRSYAYLPISSSQLRVSSPHRIDLP